MQNAKVMRILISAILVISLVMPINAFSSTTEEDNAETDKNIIETTENLEQSPNDKEPESADLTDDVQKGIAEDVNDRIEQELGDDTTAAFKEKNINDDTNTLLETQVEQSDDEIIEVRTAEDFYKIRDNLGGHYKLINDIDLQKETGEDGIYNSNGNGWIPIGNDPENPFSGSFDGNNHSISGIKSEYDGDVGGVFGYNSGSIKNLTCSNGSIMCLNNNTGGIVGVNKDSGIIEDCTNANTLAFARKDSFKEIYIGGIAGTNQGTIDGCINDAPITLDKLFLGKNAIPYIGGIAGCNNQVVANSFNDGEINICTSTQYSYYTTCYVGGIVGTSENGLIGGSDNDAEIKCLSGDASYLGGICAYSKNTSITKANNKANLTLGLSGNDTKSNDFFLGGICGYNGSKSCLSEVNNTGNISDCAGKTCSYYAGGIAGLSVGDVYYSINDGKLSFGSDNLYMSNIGGIAGSEFGDIGVCNNFGDITITSTQKTYYRSHFGGIVGQALNEATILQCCNEGRIDVTTLGFDYVGGIAGALRYSSMVSESYNVGPVSLSTSTTSNNYSYQEEGVGGIVGTVYDDAILWNAYNVGEVSSSIKAKEWLSAGGIVGGCKGGTFGNVYNTGIVKINNDCGGSILGYYSSGEIKGDCIGGNWTSRYVVRSSDLNAKINENLKHYYYMKEQETYEDFDFENNWVMSDGSYGFPVLKRLVDVDYQKELELPISLINSSDADIWVDGYTGDVVDKSTGKILVNGVTIPMKKKDISSATVAGVVDRQYSGTPITQNVQIILDGDSLKDNIDYYCSYSNNINPGMATMTISGLGKYEGVIRCSFKVLKPAEIVDLPAVKISKPKAGRKKATVKWKKVTKKNLKKIQGIEIQVATDAGFNQIVKSTTAGKKKKSKTIKGLKPKTTYWVRIRAFKNAADGKHVSAWKVKKVKIKK